MINQTVFFKLFSKTLLFVFLSSSIHIHAQSYISKRYKEIVIDSSYNHTKWGIQPVDLIYKFAAYTASFDSDDDNNGDGKSDIWGIPEWVAYEVKKETKHNIEKYKRPKWMTDPKLQKIAPNDETYAVSGTRSLKEVSGNSRYVRGHLCPKATADRISMKAGYNTHTVLNAVPQLQWQNNGIWKSLETKVNDWANKYDSVWVICGPVFFNKTPAVWLGQDDEVRAAVPDALYKIIIRETSKGIKCLGFIIPNLLPKGKNDFAEYLTSIDRIESLTGLTFLSKLENSLQIAKKNKHRDFSFAERKNTVDSW